MFFLRQENERVCRNLPTHPRVSLSCIQRAGGAHKRNQRRSERGACASPARTEARRADRGERWRCNGGAGRGGHGCGSRGDIHEEGDGHA